MKAMCRQRAPAWPAPATRAADATPLTEGSRDGSPWTNSTVPSARSSAINCEQFPDSKPPPRQPAAPAGTGADGAGAKWPDNPPHANPSRTPLARNPGPGQARDGADHRQLRRRAPRPPGHAGAAAQRGAPSRRAQLRADLRAASALFLRPPRRPPRAGAGAHRDAARQAQRTRALRHRPDRGAALRPALREPVAAGLRRRRAGARTGHALCAGRRRLPLRRQACRRLRHARCRRPARRLRRGAHEQLRGARPAR